LRQTTEVGVHDHCDHRVAAGDGRIHAYNRFNGRYLGSLRDAAGMPIRIDMPNRLPRSKFDPERTSERKLGVIAPSRASVCG
jgi:hypothetical protein